MRKLILALPCFMLIGCGESTDLGGGYFINKTDEDHVYISKKENGKSFVVIEEQVVDWGRFDGYIAVLRKVAISPDCYDDKGRRTIITHYSDESQFWIINLKDSVEAGPFSESEYREELKKLGVRYVNLDVPKDYVSNSEQFEKIKKNCLVK
ncbi:MULTISPECIES: DUF3997 domain-containing protein [unclassified Massilia]|uniref:DUF3997 domain-containing protein n=1 Tax=unclassified Massilia TaxID=2609279 RepID=UPI001B824AD1|nr:MULTISPECIES: DUF3997 domain-containing protein [unclassified Massilia]MBQ5939583.1 DUF3997 domain-containing protein [Massilia sp. AB1]MBQ5963318.1 DUF3997 domain-containing protein [Massilia sp. ZL223]